VVPAVVPVVDPVVLPDPVELPVVEPDVVLVSVPELDPSPPHAETKAMAISSGNANRLVEFILAS
jgi:hypothetical protein